jgi:hypothetical protein
MSVGTPKKQLLGFDDGGFRFGGIGLFSRSTIVRFQGKELPDVPANAFTTPLLATIPTRPGVRVTIGDGQIVKSLNLAF